MAFLIESGKHPLRYVYLVESFRDAYGRPRNRRVRIGRVDPDSGERIFSELILEEEFEGLILTREIKDKLSESIRNLRENHPELLAKYDPGKIMGKSLELKGALPRKIWVNDLRDARVESYGPIILRELAQENSGLSVFLDRFFPESSGELLEISASLVFDRGFWGWPALPREGGLARLLREADPGNARDFFRCFEEGAGEVFLIVEPEGGKGPRFLFHPFRSLPLETLSEGGEGEGAFPPDGASSSLPPPPLLIGVEDLKLGNLPELFKKGERVLISSPLTESLLSGLREARGRGDAAFRMTSEEGEEVLSGSADLKGERLEFLLFTSGEARKEAPENGREPPEEDPEAFLNDPAGKTVLFFQGGVRNLKFPFLQAACFLGKSFLSLERKLEFLGKAEPEEGRESSGRNFLIVLSLIFAFNAYNAYFSSKLRGELSLEDLLTEISDLKRITIQGKSVITFPGESAKRLFLEMGLSSRRLKLLDRGVDPYGTAESTRAALK
ncbi:MAG: hypothetical protein LBR53_12105 [Deltaproteobacteria bacterium]|jgi:hypothetical protein|nr:hypothetical protein [Deltaproteobacteria bacterium]